MFKMVNCRNILTTHDMDSGLLNTLVAEIERAVSQNSNSTFCLAYSLIDTACKTVMQQRNIQIDKDDLPKLFKLTLKELNLVPPNYNDKRNREAITKTLNGLDNIVKGVCELRNSSGIYSHGKPDQHENCDPLQLMLVSQSTDMIVSYILQSHLDYPILDGEIIYEDQIEFNEYIDELHKPIDIFGQTFIASRMLYLSDNNHDTYREELEQFKLFQEGNIE